MADEYGRCAARWHPEMWWGQCSEKDGHDGPHSGYAYRWTKSTLADKATAEKFMDCYRRIPNSYHDITLNNNGTVTMSLGAFRAAVAFIHVRDSGD